MFKTKKQLRSELDFAVGKCSGLERSLDFERDMFSLHAEASNKVVDKNSKLVEEKLKLKRDLDTESHQKEELAALYADAKKKLKSYELYGNVLEAVCTTKDCFVCQSDCLHYGKNSNHCLACIRNGRLSDRYEVRK